MSTIVTKVCKHCQREKPLADFSPAKQTRDGHRPECKACHNAAEKARDKSHRVTITPEYKRAERFKRLFGITIEDYDRMFAEQGGKCCICGEAQSWNRREEHVLPVDHDHDTGKVRGLLCHPCNQALGLMKDDPDRLLAAAAYLLQHRVEVKQDQQASPDAE